MVSLKLSIPAVKFAKRVKENNINFYPNFICFSIFAIIIHTFWHSRNKVFEFQTFHNKNSIKMPKHFLLPVLLFFSTIFTLKAQFNCLTTSDNPSSGSQTDLGELAERSICDPFKCTGAVVNLKFHVLHLDNGTDGYTESDVTACKNLLNTAYNPQGISFNYLPTHHWNKSFYLTQTDIALQSVFGDPLNQRTSDAIHVYLMKNPQLGAGKADGIPSNACFLGGAATYNGVTYQLVPSHVVSHEVGHCMGLQHTFNGFTNGTPKTESSPCTMGDFVADTPVDPVTTKTCITPHNCGYQPSGGECPLTDGSGNAYTPNLNNYMSYTVTTCMNNFTAGQGDKMRDDAMASIGYVFKLPEISSSPTSTNMCTGNSQTLTLCFPGNITWTVSPAGAINFSAPTYQNGTITITPSGSYIGTVTITATTSGGQTKQITRNIISGTTFAGTYTNNGGVSKPLYTVNAISAGYVYVTLPAGTTYTWATQGATPPGLGLWVGAGGTNASFNLSSSSVTFLITSAGPCGVTRTVTFYIGSPWGLAAWPNPASDVLHVQVDQLIPGDVPLSDGSPDLTAPADRSADLSVKTDLRVEMHNSMGVLVYSGTLNANVRSGIDVSRLENGIYWVSVKGADFAGTSKVVISR